MFTLEIRTDIAAFEDAGELPRVITVVLENLERGMVSNVVRDVNGNTCGFWRLDS